MPHFVPQRSAVRSTTIHVPSSSTSSTVERKITGAAGGNGTASARLARIQQLQFRRQHSSPAVVEEDYERSVQFEDCVSMRSVSAWSAFDDIDTELEPKHEFQVKTNKFNHHDRHHDNPNVSKTVHQLMGNLFKTDMFNVFMSMAKDGTNGGTMQLGVGGANSKEQLAIAVYKQYKAKMKLMEPYKRLRTALKHLQTEYAQSKAQNLLMRYTHMQKMIHEVIITERQQHWQQQQIIADLPVQAISETPQAYVLRIASLLDDEAKSMPSSPRVGGAIAQLLGSTICIAERTKDSTFYTSLKAKPIENLQEQCAQLSTDLYRLLHKYQALRSAVRELARAYQHTRFYPLVPRYNLLKAMIKRLLRTPAVVELDSNFFE
ncbi:hypothetical protein niasHS_002947 [Heterodera schachtii]|uniref:Uncharacterized protein n=1 Tax=Heterodera schachtii TaxID=97005 RepID=A0ABD2K9H1_HETSC